MDSEILSISKVETHFYRPHAKDGESIFFTGVYLLTGILPVPGPVLGPCPPGPVWGISLLGKGYRTRGGISPPPPPPRGRG